MGQCAENLRLLRRWAFVLGFCLFAVACEDAAVIWKAQETSADGHWVASAQMKQFGGPGTAGLETVVFLAHPGDQKPTAILVFSPEMPDAGEVEMRWLTNTHLEVTYHKDTQVDFQAIKCAGVDISLEHSSL
jgi:hypothetical protein